MFIWLLSIVPISNMSFAPFLLLAFTKLPPKPWPVTVAGMDLTTDAEESPLGMGLGGRGPKAFVDAIVMR